MIPEVVVIIESGFFHQRLLHSPYLIIQNMSYLKQFCVN